MNKIELVTLFEDEIQKQSYYDDALNHIGGDTANNIASACAEVAAPFIEDRASAIGLLGQINHALTLHGHIDQDTSFHHRIIQYLTDRPVIK